MPIKLIPWDKLPFPPLVGKVLHLWRKQYTLPIQIGLSTFLGILAGACQRKFIVEGFDTEYRAVDVPLNLYTVGFHTDNFGIRAFYKYIIRMLNELTSTVARQNFDIINYVTDISYKTLISDLSSFPIRSITILGSDSSNLIELEKNKKLYNLIIRGYDLTLKKMSSNYPHNLVIEPCLSLSNLCFNSKENIMRLYSLTELSHRTLPFFSSIRLLSDNYDPETAAQIEKSYMDNLIELLKIRINVFTPSLILSQEANILLEEFTTYLYHIQLYSKLGLNPFFNFLQNNVIKIAALLFLFEEYTKHKTYEIPGQYMNIAISICMQNLYMFHKLLDQIRPKKLKLTNEKYRHCLKIIIHRFPPFDKEFSRRNVERKFNLNKHPAQELIDRLLKEKIIEKSIPHLVIKPKRGRPQDPRYVVANPLPGIYRYQVTSTPNNENGQTYLNNR